MTFLVGILGFLWDFLCLKLLEAAHSTGGTNPGWVWVGDSDLDLHILLSCSLFPQSFFWDGTALGETQRFLGIVLILGIVFSFPFCGVKPQELKGQNTLILFGALKLDFSAAFASCQVCAHPKIQIFLGSG